MDSSKHSWKVNTIIEGCKATVWSYRGPYLQLQLSLSQLNPVCQVGDTRAKYATTSQIEQRLYHFYVQAYFAWA